MLKAAYKKHRLKFKTPGGTSRGVLTFKDSWYIVIRDAENPDKTGIGECGIIPKLSIDDRPDFEVRLNQVIDRFNKQEALPDDVLTAFPAIQFGMETALLDLGSQHERVLFPSNFTEGLDGIHP